MIAAAKARGKLAVVHVGSRAAAETAIAAGASGLVHIFGDEPPPAGFGAQTKAAGAFVIPTLSVIESATGTAGGAGLTSVPALAPFLTSDRTRRTEGVLPAVGQVRRFGCSTRLMRRVSCIAAGVPILAGSDAPNPAPCMAPRSIASWSCWCRPA